jgi:UDP-3-O-[3-hydroxymyristoyl] glucosamine N-acyltransferase
VQSTIRQLAELVKGTILGDGDLVVQAARTLHEAQPGDITFVENEKNAARLEHSQASAAIVPPRLPRNGKTLIQVADPLMAFAAVFQQLHGFRACQPIGIHARAEVHASVQIGADPSIHRYACIGEATVIGVRCVIHCGAIVGKHCRIGDDVVLYPNVVLYDDVVLGDRVVIHANSVIGADGFGYRFQDGRHVKVPQLSNVIIGSDVEIGACATVDRGAFEPTRIGDGTKIDNHVQVAHNCQIGKHNLLAAQTGVGGSSSTENYVTMAGQVGMADNLHVGEGTIVGAKSGITHDIGPNERLFGIPARPVRAVRRVLATMEKLPEMRRDLLRVLKHLGLNDEPSSEPAA